MFSYERTLFKKALDSLNQSGQSLSESLCKKCVSLQQWDMLRWHWQEAHAQPSFNILPSSHEPTLTLSLLFICTHLCPCHSITLFSNPPLILSSLLGFPPYIIPLFFFFLLLCYFGFSPPLLPLISRSVIVSMLKRAPHWEKVSHRRLN